MDCNVYRINHDEEGDANNFHCRMTKVKEKRPQVASHFRVADVKMKALNDPLPPHHPGSPKEKKRVGGEFRYYGLDLSKLQERNQPEVKHSKAVAPPNVINPTWAEKNEDLYPSVSHGID